MILSVDCSAVTEKEAGIPRKFTVANSAKLKSSSIPQGFISFSKQKLNHLN